MNFVCCQSRFLCCDNFIKIIHKLTVFLNKPAINVCKNAVSVLNCVSSVDPCRYKVSFSSIMVHTIIFFVIISQFQHIFCLFVTSVK